MRVLVTGKVVLVDVWHGGKEGGGRPGKGGEESTDVGAAYTDLLMPRMSGEVSGRPGVKGLEASNSPA